MIRLKMIRGNNDRVFFLETSGKSERVVQLDVNSEEQHGLNKKIIYELYDAKVVSIASDCRNFEDDRQSKCSQSFYILNEKGAVFKITNKVTNMYRICKELSVAHHQSFMDNIQKLKKTDWL